jgi:CRISPR-associated protein Csb2
VDTGEMTGVGIRFTLPLGRFHATAAGSTPNEAIGEWPPSPWRVLRALVSVWKRRAPELAEADVLAVLGQLAGPCEFQLPVSAVGHTRHYLPADPVSAKSGTVGGASKFLTIDAFVSLERDASFVAVWPEASLTQPERGALDRLCSEFTYLGRAESLCDAELLDDSALGEVTPNARPVAGSAGGVDGEVTRLLVPTGPLDLEALCLTWSELRSGRRKALVPPGARFEDYWVPRRSAVRPARRRASHRRGSNALRFEVVPSEPGRSAPRPSLGETVTYTSALRFAAQSSFGRLNGGEASSTLSGRGATGPSEGNHSHAHYLVISDGAASMEARRIRSFVVWAPAGFSAEEEAALARIRRLFGFDHVPGFSPCRLEVSAVGAVEEVAPELCRSADGRPALRFVSETPVVPGREPRGGRDWAEQVRLDVEGALERQGLRAAAVTVGEPVRGVRTQRPRKGRRGPGWAYPHPHRLEVTFASDPFVDGRPRPLAVGALSHFGLGLLRPA